MTGGAGTSWANRVPAWLFGAFLVAQATATFLACGLRDATDAFALEPAWIVGLVALSGTGWATALGLKRWAVPEGYRRLRGILGAGRAPSRVEIFYCSLPLSLAWVANHLAATALFWVALSVRAPALVVFGAAAALLVLAWPVRPEAPSASAQRIP